VAKSNYGHLNLEEKEKIDKIILLPEENQFK